MKERDIIVRKTIKLYAVCENCATPDEALNNIHTIVAKEKQADEYVLNRLYCEYAPHFNAWCELHNEDSSLISTFKKYIAIVYENEPFYRFSVIELKYDKAALCSLLRMFSGCIPVGASYELEEEHKYFIENNDTKQEKDNKDVLN